jgi:protein BCP1
MYVYISTLYILYTYMQELNYAAEDADLPEEERRAYADISHFVIVSRAYVEPPPGGARGGAADDDEEEDDEEEERPRKKAKKGAAAAAAGGKGKGGKKDGKAAAAAAAAGPSSSAPAPLMYVRAEDEFLHPLAEWAFTFPAKNRAVARGEPAPVRLAMCVKRGDLERARKQLEKSL